MVVYRINETLQTGAVRNRTYRVGESVYLFFRIHHSIPHFCSPVQYHKHIETGIPRNQQN